MREQPEGVEESRFGIGRKKNCLSQAVSSSLDSQSSVVFRTSANNRCESISLLAISSS